VLDVNSSKTGETGRDGFHPEARYEFRIDLDGDVVEDLTYRLSFGPRDDTGRQWLWAGRAADPFYLDQTVLAALAAAFKNGTRYDLSNWQASAATNMFKDTTIHAIVLEVPDTLLAPGQSIGVWGATRLATDAGGWRQINRTGRPMIQPIFDPDGNEAASVFNTTQPADDVRNYRERFASMVAAVVAAYGTADDPRAYGDGVADVLLPDVLRYVVGSQATYGLAVRNGRTLGDNAPEVMSMLTTNSAVSVGLDRRSLIARPTGGFPYVAAEVFEGVLVPAGG
jgi:hypothetical protein